jgi:geranylgeranyl diphosphate synthase, type I
MVAVEAQPAAASVAALLSRSRMLVDPALRAAIATLPPAMRALSEYHFGWRDEQGNAVEAFGGKAVRPLLALLSAEAVGGTAEAAVPAAVAVELVHNFSLVHDDIMDGDHTRRHRPTVWKVHGVGPAILAGDAMLDLAYRTLGDRHAAELLGTAVQTLLEGQASDLAFEKRTDVTLRECSAMAEAKTGALMAAATALGALAGGATEPAQRRMHRFGSRLGLAFQFVDDLLGIWGDPEVTGKPVHSDLRNAKKSLPVVAAMGAGLPASAELSELYRAGEPLTAVQAQRAAELVEECGAKHWCQRRADELLAEALDELRGVGSSPRTRADLTEVARLLARRDR